MSRRLLLVLVRGFWLSSFVLIFALGALRSGVGVAQETDTTVAETTTTTDLPYAFVLGEELSGPPSTPNQPLGAPSVPLPSNSPPILVGWIESAAASWYRMPLWSQAAVASAAIATLVIGVAALFRGLVAAILEGRRGP
jgi:hypothetical protein